MKGSIFSLSWLIFAGLTVIPGLFLTSCENDIKIVNNISLSDTLPLEVANDIEVVYSDSGNVQIWMKGPVYKKYGGKEPYMEFPRGIKVVFYDPGMVVKSTMTAGYAVIRETKHLMEARNNVEITGVAKNEKLNTEHLIWDERLMRIFSDQFVKITTGDKVLYGQGFESDQTFEHWVIKKPTGTFQMKQDD